MTAPKFPQWLKKTIDTSGISNTKNILEEFSLNTVCQSARCPNLWECFSKNTATFLILGNICTRNCAFCSIRSGLPAECDPTEPDRIAFAVKKLGIKYAVITSVSRDDLDDKGASHFKKTIEAIKRINSGIKIEVLVPDFAGIPGLISIVLSARPDAFAHNIETVPRLYAKIRPQADYNISKDVLKFAKRAGMLTKSGIMVGLGETEQEIIDVFYDLRETDCDILTIGQYLRPSQENITVNEYITPERFEYYKEIAQLLGFSFVQSQPFVRSSYNAAEIFN